MSKSTNKRGVTVRDRFLYFETDVYFGRALDTKVMIDNQLLCWIAGDSMNSLKNLQPCCISFQFN